MVRDGLSLIGHRKANYTLRKLKYRFEIHNYFQDFRRYLTLVQGLEVFSGPVFKRRSTWSRLADRDSSPPGSSSPCLRTHIQEIIHADVALPPDWLRHRLSATPSHCVVTWQHFKTPEAGAGSQFNQQTDGPSGFFMGSREENQITPQRLGNFKLLSNREDVAHLEH